MQNFSFLARLEVAEKFVVVVVVEDPYMVKIHSLYVVVKTSFRVQLEFKLNNKDKTKFSLFIYSLVYQ